MTAILIGHACLFVASALAAAFSRQCFNRAEKAARRAEAMVERAESLNTAASAPRVAGTHTR
jgi:hypothetical protein